MPLFNSFEFALVAVDGKSCDISETGRFRITDDGKSAVKMEIKNCDKNEWREPGPEDLALFKKVLQRYS